MDEDLRASLTQALFGAMPDAPTDMANASVAATVYIATRITRLDPRTQLRVALAIVAGIMGYEKFRGAT